MLQFREAFASLLRAKLALKLVGGALRNISLCEARFSVPH